MVKCSNITKAVYFYAELYYNNLHILDDEDNKWSVSHVHDTDNL